MKSSTAGVASYAPSPWDTSMDSMSGKGTRLINDERGQGNTLEET